MYNIKSGQKKSITSGSKFIRNSADRIKDFLQFIRFLKERKGKGKKKKKKRGREGKRER